MAPSRVRRLTRRPPPDIHRRQEADEAGAGISERMEEKPSAKVKERGSDYMYIKGHGI